MSSYRNYNDLGVYRPRSNAGVGVSLVRNSSNTSTSLTNYRPNYSSTSSIARASLAAAAAKERTITSSSGGYRNTGISKSIRNKDDKPSYKFSADKHRTSTENIHGKSPVSEKSSLFEKYPYPGGKITPSSLVEKYGNRIYGREKIREPETSQRYVASTFPGSRLRGNYGRDGGGELRGGEKKERPEHPPVSYRTLRTTSTTSSRSSREPSPEVSGTKASPIRVYARAPNYRQSPSSGESPIKYANPSKLTTGISRNASISTEIPVGYSRSERLFTSNTSDIKSTIESDVKNNNKANVDLEASDKIAMTRDNKVQEDVDDDDDDDDKEEAEKEDDYDKGETDEKETKFKDKENESSDEEDINAVTLTVITRATSPGPPASSSFVRIRRADAARTIQWEITRAKKKVETKDVEIQSSRIDDTTRYSRFSGGTRVSPWPSYLDKLHSPGSYSRMYRSSSSGKVRNFGYTRQSESLTQIPMSNESVVDVAINCQNCNSQPELSDSMSDTTPRPLSKTSHDNIPLNVTVNRVEKLQVIPVHQAQLPDKRQESTLQKRENSMSSVTSSSSSPSLSSLSSLSRRELLARSDGVTISTRGKSISRNGTMKSTKQRQMTRVDGSSDGSAVSLPTGKSKSASANSSTSQNVKIRATPSSLSFQSNSRGCTDGSSASTPAVSVNLRQCNTVEARGKPPVPKGNDNNFNMKTTGGGAKYINKDFRKSALNMPDMADPTGRSKYQRKRIKNGSKSLSISSQESAQSSSNGSKSSHDLRIMSNSKSELQRESKNSINYEPVIVQKLTSDSKSSLSRNQDSICITSSSSDISCDSSSSESSEGENLRSSSSIERKRINKTSNSPRLESRRRMSASSSRTSVLGSSADELSLTMDKPPRSMSSSKLRSEKSSNKSDNTKSFLIRTLAPVKNIFKSKDDATDTDSRPDNEQRSKSMRSIHSSSISNSSAKNLSNNVSKSENPSRKIKNPNVTIKHQYSGERAWWMEPNSDNIPDGVERLSQCQDDISQETTVSINLPDDGNYNARSWQHDATNEQTWNAKNHDDDRREMSGSSVWQKSSSYTSITAADRKNGLKHQQSGERAWWMSEDPAEVPEGIVVYPSVTSGSPISVTNDGIDNSECFVENETISRNVNRIRHVDSGEKAWWMDSNSNIPEGIQKLSPEIVESNSSSDGTSESFDKLDIRSTLPVVTSNIQPVKSISRFPIEFPAPPTDKPPLGDRASPEGVENPSECYEDNISSYDNVHRRASHRKRPSNLPLFIGNHTNIDDILGETVIPHYGNVMSQIHKQDLMNETWEESSECEEIDVAEVIIHDSTPKTPVIQRRGRDTERPQPDGYIPLDDTALQLYKDGDYGAYLDLEASISEQQEEFESFQTNRKNSIVLRTQLSVRVHTIIEKLLNSEGRELRRALFSLKQIFQEDKDLVHEFVQNDGLACLIKVGNEADQNYQNYILRALGQVMLYVDGMNGVMEHGQTVQWLYTLIASRFRLVVKTALKLLLVFVEYIETNSLLLVRAVRSVDTSRGMIPWTNVMKLLKDYDAAETELLIYATTLVNKCLNGIPDQDTYYDQVDCLEEQGIEGIIQRYMSKQGTDLDLLRQFQIYEAVLHHEDGNDRGSPIRQLDDNIRKTLRSRKSLVDSHERRKSRRHSTGTSPLSMSLNIRLSPRLNHPLGLNSINGSFNSSLLDDGDESSSSHSSQGLADVQLNGNYKENKDDVGVTPALRRRRERAERQKSFIREQQEATANMRASIGNLDEKEASYASNGMRYTNGATYERNNDISSNKISRVNSRKDLTPLMNAANKLDSEEKKPWYGKNRDEGVECDEGNHTDEDDDRRVLVQMKRDGTVKDLTQKLAAQNLIASNTSEEKISRIGDMSGLISKAKEGLAKSKSKADILKSPTGDNVPKLAEVKKSENELHWEELVNQMKRPLALCDLDFTDLNSDDEVNILEPVNISNGVPPPPPPMVPSSVNGSGRAPPPPPLGGKFPPPVPNGPPPPFGVNLKSNRSPPVSEFISTMKSPPQTSPKKNKKTVKLFWKEVREDPIILSRLDKNTTIWDELMPVPVDTQKLEHLFESRAKDLITKKQQEMNKNKEIIVLDHKRSNTINIGMTKLPPPRSIKTAILKMDATIMSREGIEKLLTMLPTEDERSRIQDAQAANPDLPLGSAEQFLLTLASISELPARLKLWAFKLDFENSEKEIADPLMDLKQGMETLKMNKTFRGILSTLLSIGIFLNGNEVKGFQLEYLTKVPEVKDTVHKHSLLHHLCHMVMEKFPDSTDLYSEIGAVTRASKIDFDEVAANIIKLESECKASWDHLKLIAKHDGSTMMKVKMSDFLADCAERIIVLGIVHRRIINRFHKFILWLGIPLHRVQDTKPNEFCRIVSEFALEYRTTRERVIQQLEKKANHRERNKTRGKMITEVGKFRTKEDRADAELRQLLGSDISDVESGTLTWRRPRRDGRTSLGPIIRDETRNGNVTDGDDELLESLVKTATKSPATRTTPRERKRTRHADRKSLRRTLKNGLSEEEKKHIAAYIKGY